MRNLILATASAIALGIAGASPIYAQNANTGTAPDAGSPAAQTPATRATQPAMPQAGNTIQQTPPSMSGSQSSSPDMASGSQSATDWGRLSRNDIEQIQQKLKQEGLYRARIDGLVGPGTQQALRAYQRKHGLPVTATLNPQTLASLNVTPTGSGAGVGSSTAPNSSNDMNMPPSSNTGAGGANNPPGHNQQ